MTPEQQRIAIAEACPKVFVRPTGAAGWNYRRADGRVLPCIDGDPLCDLNAMAEAQKTLGERTALFDCRLIEIISDGDFGMNRQPISTMHYTDALLGIHATAAQRAEAFLKTIGKWEA